MAPLPSFIARCVRLLLACLFLLALLVVGSQSAAAQNGSQRPSSVPLGSPPPAQIVQIVTTPALPNVILLSLKNANSYWLPPRYSLDAGQTWPVVMNVPIRLDQALAVALAPRQNPNPQQNVRILLGDGSQLYRTGDYGQTWSLAFTDDYSPDQELFTSPANPKRLYSMFEFGWRYPSDLYYQDLARSDDAGVTWSVVNQITTTSGCYRVIPSPILSSRVYLDCMNYHWKQSDDGGQTWADKASFPAGYPYGELALDAQDPNWLYGLTVSFPNQISGWRSIDGGTIWTPWTSPSCGTGLMAHPTKTHVLFLHCDAGLYRSTDAGDHWSQLSTTGGQQLAPDYGVPGRILWARSDGLWASTDDGDHWQLLLVPTEPWRTFLPFMQR